MSYENYEAKKAFVKQLGRLIAAMHPQITSLEYHQHETDSGLDEVVIIRHQDGYTLRADVTGSDLRETHDTVLAVLDRRECDG